MTDQAWPHLAGRLASGVHVLPVRIYYEDTDFSGVVYHASYLRFMERGRSDFLRLSGVSHADLHDEGDRLAFVVRRMAIEYLKPARIDDVLEIETRAESIGGASFTLAQTVRRGADALVTARVVAALVDGRGRPRRIPAPLRARLGEGLAGD